MPQKCIVPQCHNTSYKATQATPFFSFPKNEELRQQWIQAIQVDPTKLKKSSTVCFKHFDESDYFKFSACHKLKPGKVPHLLLSQATTEVEVDVNLVVKNEESVIRKKSVRKRLFRNYRYGNHLLGHSIHSPFLIENFVNRNNKIFYYTGVQTYKILLIIFKFVLKSESGPAGGVHRCSRKEGCRVVSLRTRHKITPLNEFFLTLMKLRRGFDYETLGDMFFISKATVCRIFLSWVNLLYTKLAALNIWPHRDVLIANAPSQFVTKYPNVVGSIDCTEFQIQRPSSLVRQSQCFSNYKGTTTLKALIMIDPNGAIIFVSALFTGSISDKKIIKDSGFCEVLKKKVAIGELQNGDIILADKGFNVIDIMKTIGVTLNIPTFRISGMQFTTEDVQYIRTIAHERIHVERAIGRLKTFRILTQKIPVSLLGTINQIFTVCALLTNFRYPLRK